MIFEETIRTIVLVIESAGVVVISITSVITLYSYLRGLPYPDMPKIRLRLAQGLSLGLEFKIGSEIIRTVIVGTFEDLAFLSALIAVRGILNYLIEKETKELRKRVKEDGSS